MNPEILSLLRGWGLDSMTSTHLLAMVHKPLAFLLAEEARSAD